MLNRALLNIKPWPRPTECDPGIRPLEYKVLVLMPTIERQTKAGIHVADTTADAHELSETAGMIVYVSPMAFKFADWPRDADGSYLYPDLIPKFGDVVRIKQYAGHEWKGRDGRNYRIIDDRDIHGIEEQARGPVAKAAEMAA